MDRPIQGSTIIIDDIKKLINPETVSGFIVDLTNVVSTPTNSELAVYTTDNALSVIEAKVKSTTDTFTDLIKKNANVFSLAGLPPGVYTLDVIAQKQNSKAGVRGSSRHRTTSG